MFNAVIAFAKELHERLRRFGKDRRNEWSGSVRPESAIRSVIGPTLSFRRRRLTRARGGQVFLPPRKLGRRQVGLSPLPKPVKIFVAPADDLRLVRNEPELVIAKQGSIGE